MLTGKALYVAVSDTPAWVVSRANTLADFRGWSPFIALQTRYNLLERSMENDLLPMANELGLGIVPWGIIAEGFLTGKHSRDQLDPNSGRTWRVQEHVKVDKNWDILEAVKEVAASVGRSPVQVALNWMLQKGVTSPLVGARRVDQLEENLAALDFRLSAADMKKLDDVSEPQRCFPYRLRVPNSFIEGGSKIELPASFRLKYTT